MPLYEIHPNRQRHSGCVNNGVKNIGSKESKAFKPHFSARRRDDFYGGEFERKLSEATPSRVFALAAGKIDPEGTRPLRASGNGAGFF
ncbi:MAG: hypothetical protein JXB25_07840, partial [Deltaproteobacteria bacterium]|nr:hypothetical protein [Deltaproteobacteria bacterium]